MPKFRKLPVIIEAIQWSGDLLDAEKLLELANPGDGFYGFQGDTLLIYTLEGTMKADPGDWIIRGVRGELYPCKPDIFEKTYELVEEGVGDA